MLRKVFPILLQKVFGLIFEEHVLVSAVCGKNNLLKVQIPVPSGVCFNF
jgi:hypothetical protein